ncbi:acyl-CoA dehydrogenase family protein [Streptomyces sp. NBC_01635]|uniref:acyl-CoA dehydrogenase family protein n=1 Tax=Streptomyces sp. NBC_01635 TaxID=2975904 RepID=UPI00386D17D2
MVERLEPSPNGGGLVRLRSLVRRDTAGSGRDDHEGQGVLDWRYMAVTAKPFASETAMAIVLNAVRVHGGHGCSTRFGVERHFRDAPGIRRSWGREPTRSGAT